MTLRAQGLSLAEIAPLAGFSHRANVKRALEGLIKSDIAEHSESIQAERTVMCERLDVLTKNAMDLVIDVGGEPRIRLAAIDTVNRLIARRCALLGLDMPVRLEHQGDPIVNIDIRQLSDEQLQRIAQGDFAALPAGPSGDRAPTTHQKPS